MTIKPIKYRAFQTVQSRTFDTMAQVLISGGTGTLGSALIDQLIKEGHVVQLLTRGSTQGNLVHWNPQKGVIDIDLITRPDVVIHLSGANVLAKKWTSRRRATIRDSRIQSGAFLFRQLDAANKLPSTYITASGISYYGFDAQLPPNEDSPQGTDFLAQVCVDWESIGNLYGARGIRVCALRTGVVFGPSDTALQEMTNTFKYGIGALVAGGEQRIAWIHISDWVKAVTHLLNQSKTRGAYNLVSPNSASMKEILVAAKQALKSKTLLVSIPRVVIKMMLGTRSAMVLPDYPVVSNRLIAPEFEFDFPTLDLALENLCAS